MDIQRIVIVDGANKKSFTLHSLDGIDGLQADPLRSGLKNEDLVSPDKFDEKTLANIINALWKE